MEHEGEKGDCLVSWNKLGERIQAAGGNKFFSPEPEKQYKISFDEVKLLDKAFKAEKPKLTAVCKIRLLNGEPSGQVWETRSLSVIKELRAGVQGEIWVGQNIIFLLKKKKDGEKTTYIFEQI